MELLLKKMYVQSKYETDFGDKVKYLIRKKKVNEVETENLYGSGVGNKTDRQTKPMIEVTISK